MENNNKTEYININVHMHQQKTILMNSEYGYNFLKKNTSLYVLCKCGLFMHSAGNIYNKNKRIEYFKCKECKTLRYCIEEA